MSALRRLLRGGTVGSATREDAAREADGDDAAREADLLAEDRERLSDDLLARQLRYADRSWTPPAQGGPRRADGGASEGDADDRGSSGSGPRDAGAGPGPGGRTDA